MTHSDILTIAILILVVLYALMVPPGPGTPLRSPVGSR
jgi:hypothetical protein